MLNSVVLRRSNCLLDNYLVHDVVKYKPQFYDENGLYTKKEWTSVTDIGKRIGGVTLSDKEYLLVEDKYIAVAKQVMRLSGCTYMTVVQFETLDAFLNHIDDSIQVRLNSNQLFYDIPVIHNGLRLSIDNSLKLLRLVLRGIVDCNLINISKDVQIYVGWDYYMHIRCPLDILILKELTESEDLYLDASSNVWDTIDFKIVMLFLEETSKTNEFRQIEFSKTWIDDYNIICKKSGTLSSIAFNLLGYCYEWIKRHTPSKRIALYVPLNDLPVLSIDKNIYDYLSQYPEKMREARFFVFQGKSSLPVQSIKFSKRLSNQSCWKVFLSNDSIVFVG